MVVGMPKKEVFSMKKTLVVLLAALMLMTSLFAEGSKETQADKPIVIEFWTHEDANRQPLEQKYIDEFCAMYPNVTVNVTVQGSEKLRELIQTAFAAGEGPTMFNLSINDERPLIEAGRIAPMNYEAAGYANADEVIAAYAAGMMDPVILDGEVYGLPLELTNWSIFINKKVFKAAGLDPETDYPKTWEDVMALSEQIVVREGDIITRRGFDFRYGYYLEWMVPMVEQLGGAILSEDGKEAIVGKDAWVKVLSFLQEFGPNGKNLGSSTYGKARSAFNKDNGDIAMCLTGLYQEARIKNDNPSFYDSGEWMVVPFPTFEDAVVDTAACYYGHYYMVNADADEATQEMAWKLMAYMLGHGEEYLETVAIIQPTNALLESDTYKNMPYSEVFKEDFNRGHIVYHADNSSEINSLLGTAVSDVMLNGVSPEAAYEALKASVQELVDEG